MFCHRLWPRCPVEPRQAAFHAIATCSLLHASDERRDAHGCLDDVLGCAPVLELLAGADALDAGLREPEPHHDPAHVRPAPPDDEVPPVDEVKRRLAAFGLRADDGIAQAHDAHDGVFLIVGFAFGDDLAIERFHALLQFAHPVQQPRPHGAGHGLAPRVADHRADHVPDMTEVGGMARRPYPRYLAHQRGAIDLRRKLEELADMERTKTGNAIRPIVLFQAQPRGKEDSTTFEKLRCKLVEAGIPAEHIAIKTAETNELKNVDLLSDSCPVRYIITVNALKEGWDCPFAYILASLANRTSRVDVEQILGRILRLPYTRKNDEQTLNMSYVLTSSNDFRTTLDAIIKGLNSAGFSKRECRVASEALLPPDVPTPILLPLPTEASASTDADDDVLNVNPQELQRAIAERRTLDVSAGQTMSGADTMLQRATETGQDYEQAVAKAENEGQLADIPLEVKEKMTTYPMNAEYAEEALLITIPQFFYKVPRSLFIHGEFALLERAQLAKDFTLKGKAYDIDFSGVDDDIASIDVRDADGVPKVFKLSNDDQNYFKKYFHTLPPENKVKHCKDIIYNLINKLNIVSSKELRDYIERIVDDMNASQVAALEKAPLSHAEKIKNKIESLLVVHFKEEFKKCLEMEKIICKPAWKLPPSISPTSSTSSLGKSLYQAEEAMNGLEWEIVKEITGVPNIKWWHRNIAKHGFRINGYINHYPDLIIMTKSGRHILVEAKGHFLKNDDSRLKLELGQAWQKAAGSQYRYYMVFNDGEPPLEGALTLSSFIEILKEL